MAGIQPNEKGYTPFVCNSTIHKRARLGIAVSMQIIKMDKMYILYAEKLIGFLLTLTNM